MLEGVRFRQVMSHSAPHLVRPLLTPVLFALGFSALLPLEASGQTRVSVLLGPTWVDFSLGGFGAMSGQLRLELGPFDLSALGVVPMGQAVAADCVPNTPCGGGSTPDAVWGGVASLSKAIGTTGLRASVGVGAITTLGPEGSDQEPSAAGSLGLDWVRTRGAGLTLGVRALGLASSIAGMRYHVLPSIGFRF